MFRVDYECDTLGIGFKLFETQDERDVFIFSLSKDAYFECSTVMKDK